MTKVIWLFADGEAESYIARNFLPMVREIPGAEEVTLSRVVASAMGEFPARFLVEARFATEDVMNAAFASAEGRRISREIMESAGKGMEMVTLDVMD